jgi:hypothetical protein
MTAPIEDAVLTFTGPVTNPRVESLVDGSVLEVPIWFKYSGTVPSGQTLKVDCANWALSGTGGFSPVYANFSHAGSARWLVIQPGKSTTVPTLSVTGSNLSGSSKTTLVTRRKFLVG